jgi:hypothetical protein
LTRHHPIGKGEYKMNILLEIATNFDLTWHLNAIKNNTYRDAEAAASDVAEAIVDLSASIDLSLDETADAIQELYAVLYARLTRWDRLLDQGIDALVEYMDDEIREELHAELAPCPDAVFLDAYTAAHLKKFGKAWELSKDNPVW